MTVPAYSHMVSIHMENVNNHSLITIKHACNGTASDAQVSNMAAVGDILIYIKPLSGQTSTVHPVLAFRSGPKLILTDAINNDTHFTDLRLTDVLIPTSFNRLA